MQGPHRTRLWPPAWPPHTLRHSFLHLGRSCEWGSFELSLWTSRDGEKPWRLGLEKGSAGNGVWGQMGKPVPRRAPHLGPGCAYRRVRVGAYAPWCLELGHTPHSCGPPTQGRRPHTGLSGGEPVMQPTQVPRCKKVLGHLPHVGAAVGLVGREEAGLNVPGPSGRCIVPCSLRGGGSWWVPVSTLRIPGWGRCEGLYLREHLSRPTTPALTWGSFPLPSNLPESFLHFV